MSIRTDSLALLDELLLSPWRFTAASTVVSLCLSRRLDLISNATVILVFTKAVTDLEGSVAERYNNSHYTFKSGSVNGGTNTGGKRTIPASREASVLQQSRENSVQELAVSLLCIA